MGCINADLVGAEDVWDSDSAYIEMLANEVCSPVEFLRCFCLVNLLVASNNRVHVSGRSL